VDKNSTDQSSEIAASIGEATCGIVHDMANLLQTILLRVEITEATESLSKESANLMEETIVDSQRGAELLRGLLQRAREEISHLSPTDLSSPIKTVTKELWLSDLLNENIEITEEHLMVRSDNQQIKNLIKLLMELISKEGDKKNSYEISLERSRESDTEMSWLEDQEWAKLTLTRSGAGTMIELDDGQSQTFTEKTLSSNDNFKLMRIRGIIRGHSAQAKVVESVEDENQKLSIIIYLPLAT
jgi:hypothetical protein